MDDYAALDAHIARVRSLPELGRRAAPDVAIAVRDELERQIGAGVDPNGKPWKRTEDGRVPLATAAEALHVGAVGSTVVIRLTGHIARHHLGRVKGGVQRQVIPIRGLPAPLAGAVKVVLVEHFGEVMHG